MHVYFALSLGSASLITKVLSSSILILVPSTTCTPSFSQVTAGVGIPLTGHLMVMVVFEAAVTLSPMFIVTGLPSPTGISRPVSGTSISGFKGSEGMDTKSNIPRQFNYLSMRLKSRTIKNERRCSFLLFRQLCHNRRVNYIKLKDNLNDFCICAWIAYLQFARCWMRYLYQQR